ncbi:hypothetical protein C5E08_08245 [Rathayibacter iranicus]|uniref:Uncharacterized protein n=3 Tax=Rathayibacter iranicus TaxID=59737 RepID=A0AAD1ACS6_9MICO|nr:hypothetical protein C7V51_08275 [Rathayibacter iranicus]PPI47373.1 hypothetical protein C5E09_07315 [Rathayibacter iranicus]PPI60236.1 hypothetical protein C5E08_08245 [Rathayibacter iranicus]PPI71784.1 hypothetical protein C5E01_07285 [Rathayibacter iranicus]PWJ64775.1 hypothetical protein B0H03_104142 [Rathayibacter iranicus NCPPB 2253 = VKM Ac-1602]
MPAEDADDSSDCFDQGMTQHSTTGILEKPRIEDPSTDVPTPSGIVAPDAVVPLDRDPLVRPADLVSALTGVALCFFSLFVFAIAHWQYFGPDVDEVSVLGWLAPLVAGIICLLVAVVSVAVRVRGRRGGRAHS